MKTIHFAPPHGKVTPCGHLFDSIDFRAGSVSEDSLKVTCKECRRLIFGTEKTPPEVKKEKEKIEILPQMEEFSFFNCNKCQSACGVNQQITDAMKKKDFFKANLLINLAETSCKGHKPLKGSWKLGLLAIEHPQSLQDALNQFPFAKAILKINLK